MQTAEQTLEIERTNQHFARIRKVLREYGPKGIGQAQLALRTPQMDAEIRNALLAEMETKGIATRTIIGTGSKPKTLWTACGIVADTPERQAALAALKNMPRGTPALDSAYYYASTKLGLTF